MDRKIPELKPNYKKIFWDMIIKKNPGRLSEFEAYFNKPEFSVLDVIKINDKLFGEPADKETKQFNRQHLSYDKDSIIKMLAHQKKFNISNIQMEREFNISRNTISKWKKLFGEE